MCELHEVVFPEVQAGPGRRSADTLQPGYHWYAAYAARLNRKEDKMSRREEMDALSPEAEALIDNGLGFLDKARSELDRCDYRFSVVSFWTAVELLLKVPLVQEHWTLVCNGKKIARKDFLTGDFQSVTYSETLERLGNILEKPLRKETALIFDRVRRHRNRVVHFYHDGFSSAEHDDILSEQGDAWFALNRLLRDEWKELFRGRLARRLARNETQLLAGNRFYATAKYKHVSHKLDTLRQDGLNISQCTNCQETAMVHWPMETGGTHRVFHPECRVCSYHYAYALVTCPQCGRGDCLGQGSAPYKCEFCAEPQERYPFFDEGSEHSPGVEDSSHPAGCYKCGSSQSVCQFGTGHLCTVCFEFVSELEICNYCGHADTFVGGLGEITGCTACKGDPTLDL
ncbi:hsdR [Erwinia sp. INIA-01]|uniref:hsdR n=1 Tax=Erwinia sp. INIA01 TaxID=2991500 RepID=UPI002224E52B|nr:hsdR [Erwinia sp. INIA01]MCW1877223.1 hsdR [Erwinia sp. INIA01]